MNNLNKFTFVKADAIPNTMARNTISPAYKVNTNFNNGIETIREISFSLNTINRLEYYKKIKIKNILDCKKIEDIYDYYYDGSVVCKEFKIDLKDKRISFMINEYKFTFNLLTGEIKKIFDTKKMLEIKRS